MAQVKIYDEPDLKLLTVFWQAPRQRQIVTKLGNGILLIKAEETGEHTGMGLLSY